MTPDDVLERLPIAAWHGPFAADLQQRAVDALEAGRVLVMPNLPFAVAAEERCFLDPATLAGERKNISLDPRTRRLGNAALAPDEAAILGAMLRRFAAATAALLGDLLPGYATSLELARTSFRPAEIAGRAYSRRHDDRLLHVDAFPTWPLAGRRILRVFCNVAPDGAARHWRLGEPFPDFARLFLPQVKPQLPGSAWLLDRIGLTKAWRTSYDHTMLGLHDAGKLDADYQANCPKVAVSFDPGTTWSCFTDQVLHAAVAGHCALEQTFHLPVAAMSHPERSPLRVLQAVTGRALV